MIVKRGRKGEREREMGGEEEGGRWEKRGGKAPCEPKY